MTAPVLTANRAELQVFYAFNYLLYLPERYSLDSETRWPLMIFLHGSGECGTNLDLVKAHGPPKLVAQGRQFPFMIAAPQCPDACWWEMAAVESLIDELQRRYRVDSTRIYLTGLSMGGYATWELAERHPERYAAIAPICGGGNPLRAEGMRELPVWAFHGALDDCVPLRASEEMITAIEAAGGTPRFTIYPASAHDAWTETYANDELYRWLLQQQRATIDV